MDRYDVVVAFLVQMWERFLREHGTGIIMNQICCKKARENLDGYMDVSNDAGEENDFTQTIRPSELGDKCWSGNAEPFGDDETLPREVDPALRTLNTLDLLFRVVGSGR